MYFFGRGISAFFNQLFKWLFWNKTGQKFLFSILIVFIFFCFIKLGEVSAVEEVTEVNYEVLSYYESLTNDFILRLDKLVKQNNSDAKDIITQINNGNAIYLCYSNQNGSSYNGGEPKSKAFLNAITFGGSTWANNSTMTNYDYRGITGQTIYQSNIAHNIYRFGSGNITKTTYSTSDAVVFYLPISLENYITSNLNDYIIAYNSGNEERIIELLSSIEDSLTNTEPTSETDSFVEVDSSSVDDLSSSSVDNVFSTMTTGFANKFTNYDLSTVNSFVWNLNGTRITFYSDTLYKMIQGTFFETLLSMLWYYIFGHYAFVWLSNIIHKIKDGSILDGLEVNEVITKEML